MQDNCANCAIRFADAGADSLKNALSLPCCRMLYCGEDCRKSGEECHAKFCEFYRKYPEARPFSTHINMAYRYLTGAHKLEAAACVRLMQSPLHWKGLFATKRILRGEGISYCPLDGFFGVPSLKTHGTNITAKEAADYRFDVQFDGVKHCENNFEIQSSFSNPHTSFRPHFLAHRINDAARPQVSAEDADYLVQCIEGPFVKPTKLMPERVVVAILDYWEATIQNHNCTLTLQQNNVVAFAAVDIEATPENPVELTATYGPGYWIQELISDRCVNAHVDEWLLNSVIQVGGGKHFARYLKLLTRGHEVLVRELEYVANKPRVDDAERDRLLAEMMGDLDVLVAWLDKNAAGAQNPPGAKVAAAQ